MTPLQVDERLGPAAAEVLGPAAGGMLLEPPGYIGRYAGIEGIVTAKDDVDMPVQRKAPLDPQKIPGKITLLNHQVNLPFPTLFKGDTARVG